MYWRTSAVVSAAEPLGITAMRAPSRAAFVSTCQVSVRAAHLEDADHQHEKQRNADRRFDHRTSAFTVAGIRVHTESPINMAMTHPIAMAGP